MNINELDSLQLSDYTKFHEILNPDLWTADHKLRPEVQESLMSIARDFQTFLGVGNLDLKDITVSGSNAAYNYTPTSDIDLHLVVDLPTGLDSEIYRELFDAKKYQYNDSHDIKIRGSDVELYVQDASQPHHSQGIYSVMNNAWVSFPRRTKTVVDDVSVSSKFRDLSKRIDAALLSSDLSRSKKLLQKIRRMRVDGLAKHGEFGVENLTFKLLRREGLIGALRDHAARLHDQELSLNERGRRRKRQRYAYGGVWAPGLGLSSDSGTEFSGGEAMMESLDMLKSLKTFAKEIIAELGITHAPKIICHNDGQWTQKTGSFGRYDPEQNVLHLATSNRHILDILRTMSHELVHCAQRHRGQLPPDAGETGSAYEDEANALAGRIMRGFAERRPELFNDIKLEESSGYIPTPAEKNDPRFSTALTVDIRPGETGRQANKLGLQTDSQGRPALLRPGKKTRLRENQRQTHTQEDWHANDRPPVLNGRPSNPDGNAYIAALNDLNTPVYRFMAANGDDARTVLDQWDRAYGGNWAWRPDPRQERGQPAIPGSTIDLARRRAAAQSRSRTLTAPESNPDANYAIVRNSDQAVIDYFTRNTQGEAERSFRVWLDQQGTDESLYTLASVTPRQSSQSTGNNRLWQIVDSANGEVAYEFYLSAENNQQDANEVGLRWVRNNGDPTTTYSVRERTEQTGTVQPQNQQWRILIDGEEVHRFWNRNNQGEANAAARQWMGMQMRQGALRPAEGAEIEVVPVMTNESRL